MKITKRQLRRILNEEEYDHARDARNTGGGREVGSSYHNVWEVGYRDALDGMARKPKYEGDDRYEAGYEMGQNEMADSHNGVNETKTKRGIKMKITKRQLRRIIKEEKHKILREGQVQEETLFDALEQYVMVLDEEMGYDVPRDQLKAEVLNFVDGYFQQTEEPPGGWE